MKPRVVLAHGAGAGQKHPWMAACAKALRARGLDVKTFDFPYIARGKKAPDPNDVLEAKLRAVAGKERVVLGGKSMGGRIASQVVAAGLPNARGLFFLGYPLHPPGNPAKLRTEHWPKIEVPTLFVQGTRDPFGSPAELAPHVTLLKTKPRILAVEGGDHSLMVPKKSPVPQAEVFAHVWDEIARFVQEVWR